MRIGLFTESYDPVINGVSASVKTLAHELQCLGHGPVVVAPRFPGYKDDEADGVSIVRLPSWRTCFNPSNPFAYPPLGPIPAALRAQKFDVVHTQQPFGMGRHGERIATRADVPLISTFHTLYNEYVHYFPVVPRPIAIWWVTRQLRRYYAGCDRIIVPSQEAGRRLAAMGVATERQVVVPTGIETALPVTAEQKAATRRRFHIPADAPIILFVGRIAREKNLDILLEAFVAIARSDSETHLLVVGSGPYRAACEARVQRDGLASRVHFAGFIPRGDLGPFYALASVFAFPSATETQGMVVAEAQSHGLPCVVVDQGGAAELVRGGVDALITPPATAAFTVALKRLLTDRELRTRSAQNAYTNPLRPTPSDMARRIVAVYQEAKVDRLIYRQHRR